MEKALGYCKSIGAEHVETSAKSGFGVDELFYNLTHSKGDYLMARNV